MFTGLIEETGEVISLDLPRSDECELLVRAPRLTDSAAVGDSIAVNGCCLTVAALCGDALRFDLLAETFRVTNLQHVRTGQFVNLEQALATTGRFGGHIVQGHIDTTAEVRAWERIGADYRLEISLPSGFARYLVSKGSIAVNGISLTVAEVGAESFVVWIIPHTFAETNLRETKTGDMMNLEFDLIAKYVERLMARRE